MESKLRAQELRIGNWVNVPRSDQSPFRIDLIEYMSYDFAKVGMNVNQYENHFKKGEMIWGHPLTWEIKDLHPIPLSEEILLKAGFVHRSEQYRGEGCIMDLEGGAIRMLVYKQYEKDGDGWGTGGTTSNCKLKHLHQLQNLYFALTVQELQFSDMDFNS